MLKHDAKSQIIEALKLLLHTKPSFVHRQRVAPLGVGSPQSPARVGFVTMRGAGAEPTCPFVHHPNLRLKPGKLVEPLLAEPITLRSLPWGLLPPNGESEGQGQSQP